MPLAHMYDIRHRVIVICMNLAVNLRNITAVSKASLDF